MSNAASRRRTHQCCLRRLVDPHAQPQFEPIVRLIAIKDGRIKGVAHPGEHEAIIEQVLWEGVLAKLSTHVSKQRKGRAESPGDAINAVLAAASYNQVAEVLWLTTP